jgi:hypothetical protein
LTPDLLIYRTHAIGFIFAGLRSGHHWMTFWGSGLTLSSIGYLVYVMFFL